MFNHKFCRVNHEITPKIPQRCTVERFESLFRNNNRVAEDQQMLADSVLKKSEHVIETCRSKTEQCKNESDYRIKERLQVIQFLTDEIGHQKKESAAEENDVKLYCKRLINAIKFLRELKSKNERQQAILDEAADVELTNDAVNRELRREYDVIVRSHDSLEKALIRAVEQSRALREMIYALDCELSRKGVSFQIDQSNLNLKADFETVSLGPNAMDERMVTTQREWEELTHGLVLKSSNQLSAAKQMRSMIDVLIRQSIESVSKHIQVANEEFRRRISETRLAKEALEKLQSTTMQKLSDISNNVNELRAEAIEKDLFVSRCKHRLANRAQRPGPELCRDRAHEALVSELHALQHTIEHLNRMVAESETTQRYLRHTKAVQDDDLGKRIRRLKTDEVDCMGIRESIEFTDF